MPRDALSQPGRPGGDEKRPGLKLLAQEGLNVGYLAFNTEKKPFDDKRVRQALNMAVNKQAILDAVFQGAGTMAKNPIPPTIWSYNDNTVDYPYDPAARRPCWKRPATVTASRPTSGRCPCSAPTTPTPGAWPS